jgi:hypothetical protein
MVANNHGFDLYRRVKQHGRAALAQSELSGNHSQAPSGSGHTEIPGWKLWLLLENHYLLTTLL